MKFIFSQIQEKISISNASTYYQRHFPILGMASILTTWKTMDLLSEKMTTVTFINRFIIRYLIEFINYFSTYEIYFEIKIQSLFVFYLFQN